MIWCPYTDNEIELKSASREHIIPLSLGGINGLELPVDRQFNSQAGSKIDGVLANDFFVAMRRNEHDVRGHSGRRPVVFARKSTDVDTGGPLQVTLDQANGIKIFCPISKKYLEGHRKKLSLNFLADTDIDIRFVAKVALSAGYFSYGEKFRQGVKHSELRLIMNKSLRDFGEEIYSIETLADGRFSSDEVGHLRIFRALCTAVSPASIVGLVPGPKNLGVFVGVLGAYMGMVNVPANTDDFPCEGAYDLGHVICPQNGVLVRVSFRRALQKLLGDM